MADFKSFAEVAQKMYGDNRVLKGPNGPHSKAALTAVGEAFQQHFRNKIIDAGPGWAPLTPATQLERAMHDISPSDPLFAHGKLYEAIDFQVDTAAVGGAVHIGVRDEPHVGYDLRPEHRKEDLTIEQLIMIHEMGAHSTGWGKSIPRRPIFTDSDFYRVQEEIAAAFVAMTGLSVFATGGYTGKKTASMFKKV